MDFEINDQPFTALNGGPQFSHSVAISFQVVCADQAELDHYWAALGEGGEYGPCGWLKDRFGVSWQVSPSELNDLVQDPDPARAHRAVQAMYQQSKIDIAAIRGRRRRRLRPRPQTWRRRR